MKILLNKKQNDIYNKLKNMIERNEEHWYILTSVEKYLSFKSDKINTDNPATNLALDFFADALPYNYFTDELDEKFKNTTSHKNITIKALSIELTTLFSYMAKVA